MKRIFQTLALLLLTTPAYAAPSSVQASYEVFSRGLKIGETVETYTRNKDQYLLSSVTTPVGLLAMFKPQKIFMKSTGRVDQQGLRPVSFDNKREGDPNKSSHAEFDWTAKQLALTNQKVSLPEGTQDRLSAMYQFMFLTLEKTNTLNFAMTNGNKLDFYHYAITPRQKLDTPAGQFDTLYLDSQGKPGEHRTEIWLATQHYNLPCKLIITDASGDQFIQILHDLKIKP